MTMKDSNVTIMVRDMDRSISFYQSIGFTLKNRWGSHYAQVIAPGITIGLHPTSGDNSQSPSNISLGFTVDSFEESQASLTELGIEALPRQEEGGQFLHFKDPDGTELYFIKPKW
jgi:catechol 2,3-dioxygenase-like lactoylglutathione lyase family enzyme